MARMESNTAARLSAASHGRRRQNGGEGRVERRASKAAGYSRRLRPQVTLPVVEPPRDRTARRDTARSAVELRRQRTASHDPNTSTGTLLGGRHGNLASVLSYRRSARNQPLPIRYPSCQDWWPTIQPERPLIGARGGIRTHTADLSSVVPPADWLRALVLGRDSNPHLRLLEPLPLPNWDTRAGAAPGIRTQTEHDLSVSPLPIGPEPRNGRPIQCCPGFSGLRGRRLSWWSMGRRRSTSSMAAGVGFAPTSRASRARPLLEQPANWKRVLVPPEVLLLQRQAS